VLAWYGFMLVGNPLRCKNLCFESTCWILEQQEVKCLMGEHRVKHIFMRVRTITMEQLYGRFDPISPEWRDGWCFREQSMAPVVKTTNHFNYIFMHGLFCSPIFLKTYNLISQAQEISLVRVSLKTDGHLASFFFFFCFMCEHMLQINLYK